MARKRVIYQSEALFVSPTGNTAAGDVNQLRRVQSANYSFDIARTDINQFGQLAAIDRIILEQPTVSLDFSYLVTNDYNETGIGLSIASTTVGFDHNSCIAHLLSGKAAGDDGSALYGSSTAVATDVKNYFIAVGTEGTDYNTTTARGDQTGVIGIGNAQITSYSVDGSVGDFVTASVSCEALNMQFDSAATIPGSETTDVKVMNPSVNPVDGNPLAGTITMPDGTEGTGANIPMALRPGSVVVDLSAGGALESGTLGLDATDLKVQSFTCGFDLSRTPIEKLGSKFAFARVVDFPTTATMDFSAIMGEMNMSEVEDLENIVSSDCVSFDIDIKCKPDASCAGGSPKGLAFQLKGAKLDSQSMSSTIGDNKTVDFSFSSQIGGPTDTTHGLKIYVINAAGAATTH